MGYGNYGRGNYGNGGYQRQNSGGYQQQQRPEPKQVDVHAEIVRRLDLYNEFKNIATNEKGITQDEFLMMAPMLGGWITSIILSEDKAR